MRESNKLNHSLVSIQSIILQNINLCESLINRTLLPQFHFNLNDSSLNYFRCRNIDPCEILSFSLIVQPSLFPQIISYFRKLFLIFAVLKTYLTRLDNFSRLKYSSEYFRFIDLCEENGPQSILTFYAKRMANTGESILTFYAKRMATTGESILTFYLNIHLCNNLRPGV